MNELTLTNDKKLEITSLDMVKHLGITGERCTF